MCPYPWYQVMRFSKDKKQQRYQMAMYAFKHGVKPTARVYDTSPKTVRKWIKRFNQSGYEALSDMSRRPNRSPGALSREESAHLVKLKAKYKRIGADQIKILEKLSRSARTIRKTWRNAGVSSRQRRKKHITKQNLRAVKKQFRLFERCCEDTKHLYDIPEYWIQMKRLRLPKIQYTFREISTGIQFLGFADELSLIHATLFTEYINEHLKKFGLILPNGYRQTDNGAEYCGAWSAKKPSAYTLAIEKADLIHTTIPPGAHRWQSDVETVHNLIEFEFYEIEQFKDRYDFIQKAYTYLLFFNLERPNSYKENKSPWQLAKEKNPGITQEALMLPPIDLDALLNKKFAFSTQRGYDVPSTPYTFINAKIIMHKDIAHTYYFRPFNFGVGVTEVTGKP